MIDLRHDNWHETITSLHRATILYGLLHNALRTPRNNYLHLPMHITPDGLTGGRYAPGCELRLSFTERAFIYHTVDGQTVRLSLADHTQKSLFEALLTHLKQDALTGFFSDADGDTLAEALVNKLASQEGRKVFLTLKDVNSEAPFIVDSALATSYARLQYAVFTGIARWRGRQNGHLSPIVVWPEHFDLSTLWFAEGDMDEYKAHINIGLAPYTDGMQAQPYLYAYIYPYPDDFSPPAMPDGAQWLLEGWRGVIVPYKQLAQAEDIPQATEAWVTGIFDALRGILDA